MQRSSGLNLGTGAFVLLGFAALLFLTTQTTTSGMRLTSPAHYNVTAKFDNIGDLKVGAPVSMAGVEIGRVARIDLDPQQYKAVVLLQIDSKYNQIPVDSDATIYTQGLLGGKFIGLTPGGSETYLKDHGRIDFTQSALMLENLIGQMFANFAKGSGSSESGSKAKTGATPAPEKPK